ncbi:patatin-like phospholipase family protein [Aureimonas leprariae]|uniref:patatin-like phospholipase family protein n=1 Tax=Plantimonas leprariae TaxID=2615207 RepID=UPI001FE98FF6|nr:patatin-like phospholipase family protein [Aureimonas leprariae]
MPAGREQTVGLALGGGGARGLAHLHVLQAFDDLGLRPAAIAGSSIGAIMGAGLASGMAAAAIREWTLDAFAGPRQVMGRLWASRPASFAAFRADGGVRLGQLNAERLLAAFLPPPLVDLDLDALPVPLVVTATDFYARQEVAIETGPLVSALAASAALPAVFRPVRRDGAVLIDGGIYNPLPFDRLKGRCGVTVAVDLNGGPEGGPDRLPTPFEAAVGGSQLMQQSIIETKLKADPPDILFRPPVSRWRVLDFMKAREILAETEPLREEVKRSLGDMLDRPVRASPMA